MLFNSLHFLIFFPVVVLLYFVIPRKVKYLWLLAASYYFYMGWNAKYALLIAFSTVVTWLSGLLLGMCQKPGQDGPEQNKEGRKKKWIVAASFLINLGILFFFKYFDFALDNLNFILSKIGIALVEKPFDVVLPVGISFYTFQSVSYIIDVYKGRVAPTATWLEYAFFLSFFPALVAGPIVRADYFLPQIRENRHATRTEVYTGLWLIILGVVKKAIIADYIAQYNDLIFNSPGAYSGFETVMGMIGYTMQIYCDFSGYSDMAIGIALIMGFKLAKNFDFPYKARNLTDFWRRWHISLSTWLRDYIYIPLGGNRKGTARTYLNNFATMLIGGLWHGAAWKFVFWGAMHGAGLAVHKASKPVLGRIGDSWPVRAASWLVTMTFVALLWVFFRADSWADSWTVVSSVFRDFSAAYIPAFAAARSLWLILMLVIVVSHCLPTRFWESAQAWFVRSPWIVKLLIFIVVVQLVIELRTESVSPFIYFQF